MSSIGIALMIIFAAVTIAAVSRAIVDRRNERRKRA